MIQGSGEGTTIIKLRDGAPGFGDKGARKPILQTPDGNYSFKEHISDVTIDVGSGNPGAVGLDWISNNVGALRNITIRSADGSGVAGLDLTRAWPGPALVRNVTIEGFDYGIDVAHAEYGPAFENILLRNQRVAAIRNENNVLAIRRLRSENSVIGIDNVGASGMVILLDSQLEGGAGTETAIRNQGLVYLRNVSAAGYAELLSERGSAVPGLSQSEYRTGSVQSLFPSPEKSLGLPIEDVPEWHDNDLAGWAKIDCGYQGCESLIQAALDSGKSTVWIPHGVHLIGGEAFRVPASVRRVLGFGSNINEYDEYGLTFVIDEDAPEPVVFEQFSNQFKIDHRSKRMVVVKSSDLDYAASAGAGKLLLDDVGMRTLTPGAGQEVWARQLNIEGDQLHVDNAGASVWIFGLKSEGKGTIVKTTSGGWTEFLGTLLYPTESFSSSDAPAFINHESSHSLIFSQSSYVDGGFYPTVVEETRAGTTKTLPVSALEGRHMPLFVGYETSPPPPDGGAAAGGSAGSAGVGASSGSGAAGTSGASSGAGAMPSGGAGGDSPARSDAQDDGGCGCRAASGQTGLASLLALLSGGALARRRKRRRRSGTD